MFKVGDKVRVINPNSEHFRCEGIIKDVGVADSDSMVDFGEERCWYHNENLERINDMNISERLSEVIKENQNLKQQISEQNIKLNKIQADVNRELKGVSDEEFREAYEFWKDNNFNICTEIWGNVMLSKILFHTSLSEFVNKYKEYKDKQNEIKVGDEVYCLDHNYKSIVTSVEDGVAVMITNNGKWSTCNTEELHKTGKRYDIESILNGLKEGD